LTAERRWRYTYDVTVVPRANRERTPVAPRDKKGSVSTVKAKIKRLLGADHAAVSTDIFPPALLKAAESKAAYVAIYIIAPRNQKWPISFGLTTDPVATYHSFQKGWWEEHCLHILLWVTSKTSRADAERIKRSMVDILAEKRRFFSRSWYDISVEEAEQVLRLAATQERVQLVDDVEKQRKIFSSAQKAWEAKMGVQIEHHPKFSVASNVFPFTPTKGRDHGKEKAPK
jgi:hypothetical protein